MLFKANQKAQEMRPRCKDGDGSVLFENFCDKERLPKPYRLFSEAVIEQGCSIGRHTHKGESEIYYVLEGTATIDDNGTTTIASKGDMHVCYNGDYHSVKNDFPETLRILCVIALEN